MSKKMGKAEDCTQARTNTEPIWKNRTNVNIVWRLSWNTYYIQSIRKKNIHLEKNVSFSSYVTEPTCIYSWHTPYTLACPLCTAPSHGPAQSSHDSQTPHDCLCPPVEDKRHRCCLLGIGTPALCKEKNKTQQQHNCFIVDISDFLLIFTNQ